MILNLIFIFINTSHGLPINILIVCRRKVRINHKLSGWNAADKVMVPNMHFICCTPIPIRRCCRTRVICAVICCAGRRITNSTTQRILSSLDCVTVFGCIHSFGSFPLCCMTGIAESIVLVNPTTVFLVNH